MTIAQMSTYFNILVDKYGSPYWTNPEISLLLNRAQIIFIKALMPTKIGETVDFETSEDTLNIVSPLIINLPVINVPSSGSITKASMLSNLQAVYPNAVYWRVLNIGYTLDNINFMPARYVRHNDWFKFQANYFKAPDNYNPIYRESYTDFQFLPVNTTAQLYITVLKYPIVMDIDNNINTDLPDSIHDNIVSIALELAGIGTRDQTMSQLLALKDQNINA